MYKLQGFPVTQMNRTGSENIEKPISTVQTQISEQYTRENILNFDKTAPYQQFNQGLH